VYSVPLLGLLVGGAFASTTTWVGGDGVWSDDTKWSDGPPANGDYVQFSGPGAVILNDIAPLSLREIDFSSNAGPLTLSGQGLSFEQDSKIRNESSQTQTLSFSGPLSELEFISAHNGAVVFNSTLTTVDASKTLDVSGHPNVSVTFNQEITGYSSVRVSDSGAYFNQRVTAPLLIEASTAVVRAETQLSKATLRFGGALVLASTVSLSGDLVVGEPTATTSATIDTNGFNFLISGQVTDEVGASEIPGKLVKTGAGILELSGDNSVLGWSGGTTIREGTVKAGSGTAFRGGTSFTLANSSGVVLDLNGHSFSLATLDGGGESGGTVNLGSGVLTISSSTSSQFAGRIVGTGSLVKDSSGTLTLTGANTYSGGTVVSSGTLKGNGRGIQGAISNNAAVVFDELDSGTYGGVLSGSGTLEKTGLGTLVLSGSNTFFGGTTLTQGVLAVGNERALGTGAVTVNEGTLKGNGAPIAIRVGGDYTQYQGTLALTLYSPGLFDQLVATGNVNLGGRLDLAVDSAYLPVGITTYSIVNSRGGSVNNTFQFEAGGASLRFQLGYSLNEIVLSTEKTPYLSHARTANSQAVAGYLDTLYPTATGDLGLVMGELNILSADSLGTALKALSPQPYQVLGSVGVGTLAGFSQRIYSQLARSRAASRGHRVVEEGLSLSASAGVPDSGWENDPFYVPPKRWGLFITGDGRYSTFKGDSDVADQTITGGGVTAGVDVRVTDMFTLGLALGYGVSQSETDDDSISVDGTSLTPAVYGSANFNRTYLNSLLAVQNSNYSASRQVVYASQNRTAQSDPTGGGWALGVEAGHTMPTLIGNFVPLVGLQMARETVDPFVESGAGDVSLSVKEIEQESLSTDLGLRFEHQVTQDPRDRFEGRLSWRHEFRDGADIQAGFAGQGGSFTVAGSPMGGDFVRVGGEFSAALLDSLSLFLSYDGDIGDSMTHRAVGGVRWDF
ncbi:MAG: autotransporter domain-containing protein, partial [Elusimicrobia bacterium]|nr:autotransporter domain-containing protein [Elusimicrobiota bacterium]